ncbi:MFS transporter [Streptomyces sp. NRRL S-244]|uniref:MFS transporter n=1 Tax=Streptomyces sp. NRRL S-244 TaxID=1463897 RepID=UPI0009986438|nr:MFS transporter [Streptomyces sp. NRRL S-244]
MRETDGTRDARTAPMGTRVRWQVVVLLFLAVVVNYVDRSGLSVVLPVVKEEFHLDDSVSGLLLGAFFWTYAAFQIPCGRLVDRFGPRRVLAVAAVAWSLVTAATGLASGWVWLLASRLLLGATQAAMFPAGTSCVAYWFPRAERATASGLYDSGARVGTLLTLPLFAVLTAAVGWRGAFVLAGAVGLVWALLWWRLFRDRPDEDARVGEAELRHIHEEEDAPVPEAVRADASAPPPGWGELLRNRTVWGTVLAVIAQSYVIYFFITWFPSYLVDARGFTLLQLGLFGMLPGFAAIVGNWLGGWASDHLVRRGRTLTFARKSCGAGGLLVGASVGAAAVVPGAGAALALLSLSFAGVSFATSVLLTIPADISPPGTPLAGTLQSLQNTFSGIAGIASPVIVGVLKDLTGSFVPGLLSAALVAVLGALALLVVVDRIDADVLSAGRGRSGGRTRGRAGLQRSSVRK